MMGLQWLLDSFYELSTCRTYTMGGAAPIPYSHINSYAAAHGLERMFVTTVGYIDALFLKEQQEKDNGKSKDPRT